MRGTPIVTDDQVAAVLACLDRDRWQTLGDLVAVTHIPPRTVMAAIPRLRKVAPVVSGTLGYRLGSPTEVRLTARSLRRRASAILETARDLEWQAQRAEFVAELLVGFHLDDLPRGNEAAA